MNKRELIKTATSLGLQYYNANENGITVEGINGHATRMYTEEGATEHNLVHGRIATLKHFAAHLKQMGRDSLKIELNNLLDITKHH